MLYRLEFTPDDNDTLLVTCPQFPEVTTFGSTLEEARANASKAIEEAIAARIAHGRDVPPWSGWTAKFCDDYAVLPTLTELKVGLYNSLRLQGATKAELARRLGWHRNQVDRLFQLDHASKLDQIEAAFAALGERLDVKLFREVA